MGKREKAKKKLNTTTVIPIVDDAPADKTLEISTVSAELQNGTAGGSTREFGVVAEQKENDGGEVLFELSRTSSAAHAESCRRLRWFSTDNMHLIVYATFFVVLSVFAVYYSFFGKEALVAVASAAVALFMLYAALCGHKLFVLGMPFDEERTEGVLECRLCKEDIRITCAGELYVLPYSAVSKARLSKHHIYLKVKSKQFPSGILLDKPAEQSATDGIIGLINRTNK